MAATARHVHDLTSAIALMKDGDDDLGATLRVKPPK